MRLVLSREKEQVDHELIWSVVLLVSGVMGAIWLRLQLPVPLCPLRTLTGIPCLTCGGTRAARHLLQGEFGAAFLQSPLVTAMILLAGLFILYAAGVLLFRMPRIRIVSVSDREAWVFRATALSLLLISWLYLIVTGVAAGP
jgi:hypothetical protein